MTPRLLASETEPAAELRHVVRAALRTGLAAGALVPRMHAGTVLPALVSRPEAVGEDACFGAPLMLQNSAGLLSELTFRRPRGKVIAALRSCEYRALVEISKLKQADLDAVLVVGIDCLGAAGPGPGAADAAPDPQAVPSAQRERLAAASPEPASGDRPACAICLWPAVDGPALLAGSIGIPAESGMLLLARDGDPDAGALLQALRDEPGVRMAEGAEAGQALEARSGALSRIVQARSQRREQALETWRREAGSFDGLTAALAACTGCLNCRRACPLCYCRECTFETGLFERGGDRFLARAARKGALRLPSEVVLYHLTRLAHVGLSCVSCGMCEAYCPSEIPLAAMFGAMGGEARKLFGYEPGRDPSEPLPLATFREEELSPR
jgi:formate dehydrogenase subunit beta